MNQKNKKSKQKLNLEAKWVVSLERPQSGSDEAVGGGHTAEDVDQQPNGVVRHVIGEGGAGVGDGDSAAAALGEVDVVDAGAGTDNELERREAAEEVG